MLAPNEQAEKSRSRLDRGTGRTDRQAESFVRSDVEALRDSVRPRLRLRQRDDRRAQDEYPKFQNEAKKTNDPVAAFANQTRRLSRSISTRPRSFYPVYDPNFLHAMKSAFNSIVRGKMRAPTTMPRGGGAIHYARYLEQLFADIARAIGLARKSRTVVAICTPVYQAALEVNLSTMRDHLARSVRRNLRTIVV